MTRYISQTETNKLIRATLKAEFPGVKFSVRGDKGGSATRISWTDGPDERSVDLAVADYRGSVSDYTGDYSDPRITTDANGEQVCYGADYIFTSRKLSEEVVERARVKAAELLGVDALDENEDYENNGANIHAVEEFTGTHLTRGWLLGCTVLRYVAGRIAECEYLGTDADQLMQERREREDLEAAAYHAALESTGSHQEAAEAVTRLTDPKAAAVQDARAAAYAQAQMPAAEPAPATDDQVFRDLMGEFVDELDPRFLAAFAYADRNPRNHRAG